MFLSPSIWMEPVAGVASAPIAASKQTFPRSEMSQVSRGRDLPDECPSASSKRTFRGSATSQLSPVAARSSRTSARRRRPELSRRASASKKPAYRSCPLAFCVF